MGKMENIFCLIINVRQNKTSNKRGYAVKVILIRRRLKRDMDINTLIPGLYSSLFYHTHLFNMLL